MTSVSHLPSINKSIPHSPNSARFNYLHINSTTPSKTTSLEKQALNAVNEKRYLYIDFLSTSSSQIR